MGSRKGRRGPGPAPLTEKRAAFVRLIGQGLSNSEACLLVGVNRRTGTRWRYGRTVPTTDGGSLHYPAMTTTTRSPSACSVRYLSEEERVMIADRLLAGESVRSISRELGRAPSTVSRESRRNRDGQGRYRPSAAHRLALERQARPKVRRLAADPVLRALVQGWLKQRWSPEQIAHTLAQEHDDKPAWQLVHETIYQAIYATDGPLGRDQFTCLRTRRRRRRPHRRLDARRPGGLRDMDMIDQRPAEVLDRVQPGHWEGDLITGAANRSAIGTLVERTTRYVLLAHLPDQHTAEATKVSVLAAMDHFPDSLRRTLTWDQGKEMAAHRQLSAASGMSVYFCDPHSPWQRPTNENTNGLLRDYFPKGTDLSIHSAERLAFVQNELNNRPRKVLGWKSPARALAKLQSPHS